jgi:hypothetical protein
MLALFSGFTQQFACFATCEQKGRNAKWGTVDPQEARFGADTSPKKLHGVPGGTTETVEEVIVSPPITSRPAAIRGPGAGAREPGMEKPEETSVWLKDLLQDFVSETVTGIACTLVDLESGQHRPARYMLDQNLKSIQFVAEEEDIALALAHIRCVAGSIGPSFLRADEEEERALSLEIEGQQPPICILLDSEVRRHQFMICVRILQMFAQQAAAKDGCENLGLSDLS